MLWTRLPEQDRAAFAARFSQLVVRLVRSPGDGEDE